MPCKLKRPSSAPPSDCLFCRQQTPAEPPMCVRLCSDFFFIALTLSHPRHCWIACLASFSPDRHTWSQLKKSSELFFCISELLRCLCRKDPLITVYWAVRLWPHHTLNSSRPSQGPGDPSCPGLGNGFSGFDLFRLPLSYQESINTRPGATFAYETQV